MILLLLLLALPAFGQLTDNFAGGNACLNNLSGKGWKGGGFGTGDDCLKRTAGGLFEITDTRTNRNLFAVWDRGPLLFDQYSQVKINNPGGSGTSSYCLGAGARMTWIDADTGTYYAAEHCRSGTTSTIQPYKVISGTRTNIGAAITSYSPQVNDDILRLTVTGTTLKTEVLRGSSVIMTDSRTDSDIASGRLGVVGSTGSANLVRNVICDDFQGGDATPGVSPTLSYYVSATGNDKADGTKADPLSITQAFLCFDGILQPGNRVWKRGGAYAVPSSFWNIACTGALGRPIIFRAYPGELPKFDGIGNTSGNGAVVAQVTGSYTWLWGSDWFSSFVATEAERSFNSTNAGFNKIPSGPYFSSTATGAAIIHNYIHDDGGSTVYNAPASYLYGNIFWNNGGINSGNGSAKGQCIYMEGTGGARPRIENNICFNPFDSGTQFQGSGSGGSKSMNYIIRYNAFVQGGMFQSVADGPYLHGLLLGANARCGNNILHQNSIWNPSTATRGNGLEWFTNACVDLDQQNNHFVTAPTVSTSNGANHVTFLTHSGNKYYGGGIDSDTNTAIAGNTHSATRSSSATPDIYYYKSLFEYPRCHVHVFTHDGDTSESIDPSQCGFVSGDPLRIRDAFNPLGTALSETTYAGGTVSVTTNRANADVAQPIAWTPRSPVHPNQGTSRFSAFILDRTPIVRTLTRSFHDGGTGAAKIRVKYGTSNDSVTIDARPIEVTISRPNTTISTVSAATKAVVTLTRPAPFPVNSKPMLMFNIADSCWRTALSKQLTIGTGADAPLANQFTPTPAIDTSGCSAWAEAAAKLLFSPNPLDLKYTGSPLFSNDTMVLADGTGDWTQTNGTHTITSGDDGLAGLPTVNILATGANTMTTVGTAMASTAHGLVATDFVMPTAGAQANIIRKVASVTDVDNVVLDAAFPADIGSGVAWGRIEADFEEFTGTVPSVKVNRNPLTFDIRSGYFDPAYGVNPPITIVGPTDSCWKGAIGTWTATLVTNGRFTIPFNADSCGTSVGQTFTLSTPRALDYPEIEASFVSNRATVSIPVLIGKSWFLTELVNSLGTVIARSDRHPITSN